MPSGIALPAALDERLKFERLVSEVSASLINPPPARADEELEKALHKTAIALALDRCSVFQYHPARHCCRITHSAESAESPAVRREIAEAELPWLLGRLRAGVTVVLNEVARDLPAEAIAERRYADGYGSRSWLAVPVTIGDGILRAVSFHSIRRRDWSAELVSRLQLLAEIFVSSVGSQQAREALQASEERYREVVESQTELVCRYLPDRTLTFVNEAYCRFFGRRRRRTDRAELRRADPGVVAGGGVGLRRIAREGAARMRVSSTKCCSLTAPSAGSTGWTAR